MRKYGTADSLLAELTRLGEQQDFAAVDELRAKHEVDDRELALACREWAAAMAAHQVDMPEKGRQMFARAEARIRKFFDELDA